MANGQAVSAPGDRPEGRSQPAQQPLKRQKRPAAEKPTSNDAAVNITSGSRSQQERLAPHAKQQMRQKRPTAETFTSNDAAVNITSKSRPQQERPTPHAKQQMRPKPDQGISQKVQKPPGPS